MTYSECFIGLGANLNKPKEQIKNAIALLENHSDIELLKISSFYQSPPLDNMPQPDYINAVIKIKTSLKPIKLLNICQEIENKLGRVRTTKWGARIIDLDILLFAKQCINTTRLIVPHYNMHLRGFVLLPLFEIEPELSMPNNIKIKTLIKGLKECPTILP
ncbi:2-amino-4-hydroxy-6-hydroxymethyldihydropteridinepyrophosphokinase [hydrothermal vent metagenome]|uniref:2-amino-4-hydroxy-6-hydroxymethyldihydropteridine diphosphokinase n=1 Tax=hydrothermal vent metagenome TaxID=652676 RepID=A0A1W1C379_9ZZZZ